MFFRPGSLSLRYAKGPQSQLIPLWSSKSRRLGRFDTFQCRFSFHNLDSFSP